MIPRKHILLSEAELVLVRAGAGSVEAGLALSPFCFWLDGEVLVQRAKLAELLDALEAAEGNGCGC